MIGMYSRNWSLIIVAALLIPACASRQRMGMVTDEKTGLQFGSVVEKNIVIDAVQLSEPTFKLRIRNTSGDSVFDLTEFQSRLESAFIGNGYERATADDRPAMLIDVNVRYSGQISKNMSAEYAFLGGAAGGIAGYRSKSRAGTAIGIVSGATLGAIIGSYVTEDTYIVITDVTISLLDKHKGTRKKTISFGGGEPEKEETRQGIIPTYDRAQTSVAAYAGGLNTPQSRIAREVRLRLIRILKDII